MFSSSTFLVLFIQLLFPAQTNAISQGNTADQDRLTPLSSTEIQLSKQVKLTYQDAKAIALSKAPGTVFNWELEKEGGLLIYTIEIQLPTDAKKSREVNINAMTGKVIDLEVENLKKQLKAAGRK